MADAQSDPYLIVALALFFFSHRHNLGVDLIDSCVKPEAMYADVDKDLGTLLQLFDTKSTQSLATLLRNMRLVVGLRLWLCRWYAVHNSASNAHFPHCVGCEGGIRRENNALTALTGHREGLRKEEPPNFMLHWRDLVSAEAETVALSLQSLVLMNSYPYQFLSVVAKLVALRAKLLRWKAATAAHGPASARGVAVGETRLRVLIRQFYHLVYKLPFRFDKIADQVMDLSQYNTEILGLCGTLDSPFQYSSPRRDRADGGKTETSSCNPYMDLIVDFLLSYGPTAQICVAIFLSSKGSGTGEASVTRGLEENCSYALPVGPDEEIPSSPQRKRPDRRDFLPVFSMTSFQAATGGRRSDSEHPPPMLSSLSSSLADAAIPRLNSGAVSSFSSGLQPDSRSQIAEDGKQCLVGEGGLPHWFWDLCRCSGLWPAIQGRIPEGGAQRFSLLGVGSKEHGTCTPSAPMDGTFIHQSGRTMAYSYFVAHISPWERLVVAFGDRTRPATDRVVLTFLMAALSILKDSVAFRLL